MRLRPPLRLRPTVAACLATLVVLAIAWQGLAARSSREWREIATLRLQRGMESLSMEVTGVCSPLAALRLKALDRTVQPRSLAIRFSDGRVEEMALTEPLVAKAGPTLIPLAATAATVTSVELRFVPIEEGGRIFNRVRIYGKD